ncbi:MAG: hypothetical protein ACI4TB_10775 [Lachnospiraceae bacterium]
MIGMLAFSKAGHDKRTVYMIIREDAEYVYLCDGRLKTLAHPKKKNKKHIQPVRQGVDTTVREKLLQGCPVRDEEIKKVIKDFSRGKEVSDV